MTVPTPNFIVPTPAVNDSSNRVASTEFVSLAITNSSGLIAQAVASAIASAIASAVAGLTPSGLVLLQTQTAATTAAFDFVHGTGGVVLDDTYDRYKLAINTLRPVTDDVGLWLRVGTGVSPSYATTNYAYNIVFSAAATTVNLVDANFSAILLTRDSATNAVGNAAAESVTTAVEFANPESATQDCLFTMLGGGFCRPDGALTGIAGGVGRHNATAAITGIRIMFDSGDIMTGSASLYGYRK